MFGMFVILCIRPKEELEEDLAVLNPKEVISTTPSCRELGYPILEIKLAMLEFGQKMIWVFNLGIGKPSPELVQC